ncbi:hypothetical protein ABIE64_002192 [Thalassospira sp. MBR-102]|jgi:hypothetical protein|uniref:hypothetical protein n=1 Tax=Thalassospira TaxID=168934 RepID=UPI000DEDF9E6|nr:hypothetical protein [Thalassospira xiamenensis]MBR9778449.1 hypothetical protein [Rhodospirillales bacterium]MBR9816349.1 hypothetical protein [Rhodospirillales bacterium]RCK36147.1 hypothetical protein TH9_05760 [Thalassospira xiamenensis]
MENVIVASFGMKLFLAVIAFLCMRVSLWMVNRALGFDLGQWLEKANDQAISDFHGRVYLGVCIMFGLILS